MSDSEYIVNVNKQIKCQLVNYHRECLIPAFCQNIWALKKWCVTKVAHCIVKLDWSMCFDQLLDRLNYILNWVVFFSYEISFWF